MQCAGIYLQMRPFSRGRSIAPASDLSDEHYFTPQEASKLLPDLKPRVKALMERKKVIDALKAEVEKYGLLGVKTKEFEEKSALLDAVAEEMMRRISELEDLGVVVRDLDMGLIDFPADRYGEKVFLCWRYGETDVGFWHRPDEGFSGRKTLRTQLISP